MTFDVCTAAQGTPEWLIDRVGHATGSRASAIVAKIKKGESAERRDYRVQLACERLTGQPAEDGFISADMKRGTLLEPDARLAYEAQTGAMVQQVGFLRSTAMSHVGCSLDGYIGDVDGIIEIKCPKSATHVSYLEAGVVPADYRPQITHNLLVSGARWCDFLSYDPRLPADLQLFIARVYVGDLDLAGYKADLLTFLHDVDETVASLTARRRKVA